MLDLGGEDTDEEFIFGVWDLWGWIVIGFGCILRVVNDMNNVPRICLFLGSEKKKIVHEKVSFGSKNKRVIFFFCLSLF